jgi:aspartate ammonia-lyase
MNVNEVIANLAAEQLGGQRGDRDVVNPHDDVNRGQSTNNIFPSGAKIAVVEETAPLLASVRGLERELRGKSEEFAGIRKSGRTHLRDAVPITLGQEFGAWAWALVKAVERIETARRKLLKLGAGGNAIGTGINTKKEFRPLLIREISLLTGETYEGAENPIQITQFMTDFAEMSSALRLLALDVQKICNDLRLLSSGPRTGLGEIDLPPVEPGSSIMPGKVNPSICEAVNMVCMQVMGYDHAVSLACGAGQLELNTHMPLIAVSVLKSVKLLSAACRLLAGRCVAGIVANRETCGRYFETSAGLATVLNPKLGYARVAEIVAESLATGKTLRQLVLEKKLLSAGDLDELLANSTGPTS